MNIMSLDCEFNQPSQKTIQIGAAAYKVKTGELLGSFETKVCPGEILLPEIVQLTGITDCDVMNAPDIKKAFAELKDFHRQHKCFKNPIVWGSGVRNDSSLLYDEAQVIEPNFMGFRVIDAKTLYQSYQLIHQGTIRGGLEAACSELGLTFAGKPHDALADAMNTFTIWKFLSEFFLRGSNAKSPN